MTRHLSEEGAPLRRREIIMGDYRRLILLVLIMTGVTIIVGLTALGVFYDAAFERERQRLVNFAESQARLMLALGPAGLPQVLEDQRRLREKAAGRSAELQLARREGESIVFLTAARGSDQPRAPVTFRGPMAEPMTQALLGRSGTMIGRDYADRRVLAAFEPLPALGLGLVAKIDMAEINGRYLRAGLVAGFVSLVAVVGAALLFIQLGEPMIRRMRESESRYRALFENMDLGVAVYQSLAGGEDFAVKDFNRAAEQISQLGRQHVINKKLTDMFPGAEEFGAIEVTRRVWQTGRPERLPTRYYRDERIAGWWDVSIYKLPTGEVVTLFADVSERERQAEALRQSEARYRNLVEAQPDPICQFLPDTTLTFVNHAYAQFYGTEPQELIGKRWLDFAAPDERPRFLEELSSFTPEHPQRQEETSSTRIDPDVRWNPCHLYSFFDDAGHIISFQTFGTDITARKRAEEQLARQIDLLTAITDSAADAIFVSDGEERITFMNPAAERIFGWSREQLMGRKQHDAIHHRYPDGRPYPASECPLRRVYATGETLVGHEDVFFRKDGSPVPVACSNAPLKIEGRIAGAVLVAHDITQRKEAERALSESENRMRALLDASQDEILLLGIEGDVLAINKAAEHRLARRADGAHLIGAQLDRLLSHDQAELRLTTVREVAATRKALHCEVPVRSRWFDFWYYPVVLPDKPVTEVAIYAREVTEQKKLLADLGKLFQAVQQSPMSVIITDREGTIEYVNPEFTKVTGYTAEEAIGQNPRILKSGRTPPELYEELWQTITAGGVWRGEFLNKKKNGELYWELASIGAVKEGEKLTNFVAVKEDITARREMEEQLRQSQKMQVVGQLTGGIAHDFNNLLAIVIGNVQLLRERLGSDDAKAREYLDDALWSARRGGELTHRLLAFARKQPLKPSVIDLNDVVRGMSELLRRTLGARIHIEESLATDVWKAVADRGELERGIVNLALNSRDAMPTGGTLSLETRNALLDEDYCEQYEEVRPGEYVLLAVTDTGAGMPPEIVERVFEPFFTTKEMGEGSGLGLSMVYGFVKQSGGHISIYSRAGHGTSVKLYLPRVASSPDGWADDPSDAPAGDLGSHVVLVVEDEPKLRKAAVKMLERLGLRSIQAENAKDAVELLAAAHPDVLFTDIELPGGMSGTDLADAAHELDPNIKVLFTTGYAREAVLHKRWLEEKVPWLLKPYSHLDLARELRAMLVSTVD